MPKSTAKRSRLHEPSAKPAKRQFAVADSVAVEHVEIGGAAEASGSSILQSMGEESAQPLKKKEKQQMKRELLLQKIGASHTSHSKSHERRAKRKTKEQIGTGVSDMQSALAALEDIPEAVQLAEVIETPGDDSKMAEDIVPALPKRQDRQGLIGEGKNATLSQAQRRRALKTEQARLPIIRKDPSFAANPFQAIRAHAANTLIKHQVPGSA